MDCCLSIIVLSDDTTRRSVRNHHYIRSYDHMSPILVRIFPFCPSLLHQYSFNGSVKYITHGEKKGHSRRPITPPRLKLRTRIHRNLLLLLPPVPPPPPSPPPRPTLLPLPLHLLPPTHPRPPLLLLPNPIPLQRQPIDFPLRRIAPSLRARCLVIAIALVPPALLLVRRLWTVGGCGAAAAAVFLLVPVVRGVGGSSAGALLGMGAVSVGGLAGLGAAHGGRGWVLWICDGIYIYNFFFVPFLRCE